jgi:hypothetical protein
MTIDIILVPLLVFVQHVNVLLEAKGNIVFFCGGFIIPNVKDMKNHKNKS